MAWIHITDTGQSSSEALRDPSSMLFPLCRALQISTQGMDISVDVGVEFRGHIRLRKGVYVSLSKKLKGLSVSWIIAHRSLWNDQ